MKTETMIRPWVVGGEAVYVVGIEGVIDAKTDDSITINGLTLPTVIDRERGIRYLSMTWPESGVEMCDREHCAGTCDDEADETEAEERVTALTAAINEEHDAAHDGPFLFCAEAMCREANR